jgi:hypothetical protein
LCGRGVTFAVHPIIIQAAGRHWLYGYLLAWLLVLQYIETAVPSVRARLVAQLNTLGAVDALLALVFRLALPAPRAPAAYMAALAGLRPQAIDIHAGDSLALLGGLVYMRALIAVPAMCRAWYTSQTRRQSEAVDRFTAEHVSPMLVTHEVEMVREKAAAAGDMRVRASAVSRMVTATYTGMFSCVWCGVAIMGGHGNEHDVTPA